MSKYSISSSITISVYTEVEAETEEEAIKEAQSRGVMGLCYQCANGSDNCDVEWVTSGELDGVPMQDDEPFEIDLID